MAQIVRYATKYSNQSVTDAEYDLIQTIYRDPTFSKIHAIKFLRQQYRLGLYEAKEIADTIGNAPKRADY